MTNDSYWNLPRNNGKYTITGSHIDGLRVYHPHHVVVSRPDSGSNRRSPSDSQHGFCPYRGHTRRPLPHKLDYSELWGNLLLNRQANADLTSRHSNTILLSPPPPSFPSFPSFPSLRIHGRPATLLSYSSTTVIGIGPRLKSDPPPSFPSFPSFPSSVSFDQRKCRMPPRHCLDRTSGFRLGTPHVSVVRYRRDDTNRRNSHSPHPTFPSFPGELSSLSSEYTSVRPRSSLPPFPLISSGFPNREPTYRDDRPGNSAQSLPLATCPTRPWLGKNRRN
jgi:hypothetical protein